MAGSINSPALDIGSMSLNALWKRASVISDNIANADTPGYVEKSVSFEEQLQNVLKDNRIDPEELSNVRPFVVEEQGKNSDSNGVDIEQQMVELTRNQLQYNYLVRAVSDNLGLLRSVASEGRK